MPKYNQLDLLSNFDKSEAREDRLVDELIRSIGNLKFLRTNVRFTDIPTKAEVEELLSQILYWMAFVTHKKARYVEKYKKHRDLEYFLAITREKGILSVSEPLSHETMSQYLRNENVRLRALFMVNKDILGSEQEATKRILSFYDKIQGLL